MKTMKSEASRGKPRGISLSRTSRAKASQCHSWRHGAKWIWASSGGRKRRHELYGFAAEFSSAAPQDAEIRIAASCGYELWLDGRYIQRGPLRCPSNAFAIDVWPVKIDRGGHQVVLLVQRDGEPGGTYVYQPGRLLVEIVGRKENVALVSDARWRCSAIPEWERHTYACGYLSGFSEHWVESGRPWTWPPNPGDTKAWEQAVEVGCPGEFGEKFQVRDFPGMADTATVFSNLLKATQTDRHSIDRATDDNWLGVQFRWRLIKGNWLAHVIPLPEDDRQAPPSYGRLAEEERHAPWPAHVIGLPGTLPAVVRFPLRLSGLKGEDLSLLWDFGGSFAGRYRLTFSCESAGMVDIRQGEILANENNRLLEERPDRWGDRFEAVPGRRTWRLLVVRAGRYVQLIFRGFKGEIKIEDFHVEESHYPWVPRPTFECADAGIARIFHAALRTSELCFDDIGMDCPHRERIAYQFDGWPPAQAIFFGSGDARPWRRALELQTVNFYPNRPAGPLLAGNPSDVDDSFPAGNLFYLHEVAHYYRCTGDKNLVRALWPVLAGVLQWYRRFEWQGLLRDVPGRHFYEWTDRIPRPPLDRPYPEWIKACVALKGPSGGYSDWDSQHSRGASAITNSLYIRAIAALAELAPVVGDDAREGKFNERLGMTRQAFRKGFWVEEKGMFSDRLDDNGPVDEWSEMANAYALWAGVLPQKEGRALIAVLRDPNRLMIRMQSPYALHYYVYGLADYGEHALAVDFIRWAYLHHLDNGGNTLGERFIVGSSMIHGVTGFIAVWLLERGLGLHREVRRDGGGTWTFRPPPGCRLAPGSCKVYPGGQEIRYRWSGG